jgi:short-subunit dehydrogenase
MAIPTPTHGSAALITGASSGIGRELARQLAHRGHDLILVARRRERLELLAEELRATEHRRVEVVPCDVSEPASRADLAHTVETLGLRVDVLALAAGFGLGGALIDEDPDRIALLIRTNFESVVALTRRFAPAMAQRRRGAILIVSSIAGDQPMPGFGVYAASKAAITSFGESLHEELRSSEVTVTVLCPGGVETEFAEVGGVQSAHRRVPGMLHLTATACADEGLRALGQGKRKHIPVTTVRLMFFLCGHMPRGLWLRTCARLMS